MGKKVVKKICLLGDGSVGKTSLIRRFVDNTFSEDYLVTIECNISKKQIDVSGQDGENYDMALTIWDIMGHKGITSLHQSYFGGAKGALIVCDITRDDTLENVDYWIKSLYESAGYVPVIILANKSDLIGKEELGIELAQFGEKAVAMAADRWNAAYFMVSAKTGLNVDNAFDEIGALMVKLPDAKELKKLRAKVEAAYKSGKLSEDLYKKNLAKIKDQESKIKGR